MLVSDACSMLTLRVVACLSLLYVILFLAYPFALRCLLHGSNESLLQSLFSIWQPLLLPVT
jgi:hypothetical protein